MFVVGPRWIMTISDQLESSNHFPKHSYQLKLFFLSVAELKDKKAECGPSVAPLTVLTVWFVLVLCVGQGQDWVRAAGQAGVAARLHTPAPEAHGTFRWHHPLVFSVHVWACANGVAAVGEAHLCAEGQATACGWFTYSQLPQVKVLTCKKNATNQLSIYLYTWSNTNNLQVPNVNTNWHWWVHKIELYSNWTVTFLSIKTHLSFNCYNRVRVILLVFHM